VLPDRALHADVDPAAAGKVHVELGTVLESLKYFCKKM
jgi:hypothetical protein